MNQVLVARDRDADLIPENVRVNIQIYDTLGTFEGSGSGNSGSRDVITDDSEHWTIGIEYKKIGNLILIGSATATLGNKWLIWVWYNWSETATRLATLFWFTTVDSYLSHEALNNLPASDVYYFQDAWPKWYNAWSKPYLVAMTCS